MAGTVGFPESLLSLFDAPTLPHVYPADYSNISHSRYLDLKSRIDNLQVNATKEHGTHSMKFGFALESAKQTGGGIFSADLNFNRGMTSGPTAATDSTTSGNSMASLLLGTGSSGNIPTRPLLATNKMYYALYFQDPWRVNRRLTLNYGLRWETQKPTTERYNRGSNFLYDVQNPLGPKVGMDLRGGLVYLSEDNRYQWNPDWVDFAPRIGLSYKVTDAW
jgi:outer membrane receptor protein involved in Fe transport